MIVTPEIVTLLDRQLREARAELDNLIDPIYDAERILPGLRRELSGLEQALAHNLARRKELEDQRKLKNLPAFDSEKPSKPRRWATGFRVGGSNGKPMESPFGGWEYGGLPGAGQHFQPMHFKNYDPSPGFKEWTDPNDKHLAAGSELETLKQIEHNTRGAIK